MLELDFGFGMTAKSVEQVASDTVQEVVPIEGARLLELVDEIEASLGAEAVETATARLSSTIGEGVVSANTP